MLDSEVLLLNRVYVAVQVTSVRRAFGLLYQGRAKAVLPDYTTHDFDAWLRQPVSADAPSIGTVRGPVLAPRVLLLASFDGIPRHEVRFSRRNVFLRDGHRCQYCGEARPLRDLNLDHVVPVSRGGPSAWENVVCCCVGCNRRKGDRSPEAAGMRLLRTPRRPRWHPLHGSGRRARYPAEWRNFVDPSILDWRPDPLAGDADALSLEPETGARTAVD